VLALACEARISQLLAEYAHFRAVSRIFWFGHGNGGDRQTPATAVFVRRDLPDGQPRRKAVLKTRAVQTLRDCRTPSNRAKRLDCGAFTAAFSGRLDGRSAVSAERRHLKTSGKVCGGLPTRRHEAGESSTVPLKICVTGFAGRSAVPESGAKDTRSPDASRLPDAFKLRKASGMRRVHRRS
jgi:hypothetical protein